MDPAPRGQERHDGDKGTVVEIEGGPEEKEVVRLCGVAFQDAANIPGPNDGTVL